MRLPGRRRATLAARWLKGRWKGGALILGYHRVIDAPDDPFDMCVAPGRFDEQMEVLRREAVPVPLGTVVDGCRGGELPERAVAVTFDDGYADNLLHARPVLERHGVPATLFVATGALGGRFWWDELAAVLPATPERLAELVALIDRLAGERGATTRVDPSGSRRDRLVALAGSLESLGPSQRGVVLRHVAAAGAVVRPADRALTGPELQQLGRDGLVEVGGHTVSHVALAGLPPDEQRAEIEGCKRALEELLGRPVTSFAYPNGSLDEGTPGLVRRAGFDRACASHNDLVRHGTDPYRLPRFWIGDWDGERFARWLHRWLKR